MQTTLGAVNASIRSKVFYLANPDVKGKHFQRTSYHSLLSRKGHQTPCGGGRCATIYPLFFKQVRACIGQKKATYKRLGE